MIVAGGIVTQKPIGLVSSNPNLTTQQQAEAAAKREAEKQAKVDALAAKLAEKHQAKKWTVPYK